MRMRIGELAAQAGTSTKAIRYYEQIGILIHRPAPPPATAATTRRPWGGWGSSGLTLGEIRQVIAFRDNGQAPCAHVSDLLQRHAAELDARIRELQQLRGELRQLAERAATLDPEQCPPERVCHLIT
jgi:MerR family transcriptional regulator, copper efflux regulator